MKNATVLDPPKPQAPANPDELPRRHELTPEEVYDHFLKLYARVNADGERLYSQKELARLLDRSQRMVRKYEARHFEDSVVKVEKAAEPKKKAVPAAPADPTDTAAAKALAWSAIWVGTFLSIAANVLYMLVVKHPESGLSGAAQIGYASVWPIVLAVSSGVVHRQRWTQTPISWTGRIVSMFVALMAFYTSWEHMSGLFLHWGASQASAYGSPLAVDGLIIVGALALIQIRHEAASTVAAKAKEGNS